MFKLVSLELGSRLKHLTCGPGSIREMADDDIRGTVDAAVSPRQAGVIYNMDPRKMDPWSIIPIQYRPGSRYAIIAYGPAA